MKIQSLLGHNPTPPRNLFANISCDPIMDITFLRLFNGRQYLYSTIKGGVGVRIQLKDVSLYYDQYGNGPRTALCFHGWGMSADSWSALASFFPPDRWRLVMPDLRGFGRSDKPATGYHINDYMRDAIRLTRALGLTRIDVFGHSFGGTGALYLAARIPHLVRRLVVMDTIPGAANPQLDPNIRQQFERIYGLVQRTNERSLPTLLTRVWRQSFVRPPDNTQIDAQSQAARLSERHAILATLQTILTTDISAWLHHLTVPTLIIRGAQDPLLKSGTDGLENLLHVTRAVIPQTGHYPHLENPSATYTFMQRFLEEDAEG